MISAKSISGNEMTVEPMEQRQGVQSVEIGARLLSALAANDQSMMLRDLAKKSGMSAAKAHRYLVSFIRIGLVQREAGTGRYDLGDFALKLGLASLARVDFVRLAMPILEDLCREIGEAVALAIWGDEGVTCVHCIEPGGPITVALRVGTVLPLTTSAAGLLFAAFGCSPRLKKMLDAEARATAKANKMTVTTVMHALEERLEEIRGRGMSRASGALMPGIAGISAPVFDHAGHMVAAIVSGGMIGRFNTEWNSPLARRIEKAAIEVSIQLGYGYAETNRGNT
ncbi:IclR family transcriptional regulator [Dechloromonas agitata]|uniref:IclR family transcriptional regulator n=1 Tax=Dechloromonas agitata TaxID=73030 RepID=UPI00237EE54A|nr:IclR family transcriptional regulator [Dechloromonas agitata]MDE1544080.1 IclR family transcriptional regulator [Dechloromonas agitata]